MVKLRNPKTGKIEEIDDYHYFDVEGVFPQYKELKKRRKFKVRKW